MYLEEVPKQQHELLRQIETDISFLEVKGYLLETMLSYLHHHTILGKKKLKIHEYEILLVLHENASASFGRAFLNC
jgi:hypothetical protein